MRRIALSLVFTLLAALGLCWLAGAAPAPSSVSGGESDPLAATITVKWQDSSLKEVFATIFGAIDADYVLTDDVSGIITMQKEASARDILDQVCAIKGLHYWKKGGAYVVSTKAAPEDAGPGQSEAALPASGKAADATTLKQRFYKVQYWNPRDLASWFNRTEGGSVEGSSWRADYTSLFSRQNGEDFVDTSLQPFAFGRSRLGESSQFPAGLTRNNSSLPAALRQQRPQLNPATTTTTRTNNQPLQNPQLSEQEQELMESGIDINAPFAPLLPSGMTAPIAFEPLNLLIFEATDEAYDRFLELLRIFDQKPKQMILEVQFVTMSTDDAYAFGANWRYLLGGTALSVTGLDPGGNFAMRINKGNNFQAQLSALMTVGKARVVNAPRIAAMNNYTANIHFLDRVPYVDFSGATAVGNQTVIAGGATLRSVDVPTDLTITPRINADNSVTALLSPVISSYKLIEVPTPSGGSQQVPLVSQNSLSTLLNMKDGETMVIGGFVTRNETTSHQKMPLLSDLPILGKILFTSTKRNTSESELLIFVTPHVIKDESETTTVGPY
jgi:type II secretory pathway component GspD/PulD (secretin)